MLRAVLSAVALSTLLSAPAVADHWMPTADPAVVQALNELTFIYGAYCQQGNPQACQMAQSVQSHGAQLLNAGYDCKVGGNQQACAWYQNANGMLWNTYNLMKQAMNQGQVAAPVQGGQNPLGETHQDRMRAIENWGQERRKWGDDQANALARNNEEFLKTMRE